LLIIQTNGFTVPESTSSEELDYDLSIDESDYWDFVKELNNPYREKNLDLEAENEKWNEIDNLEITFDDEEAEQLTQFSDVHGSMKYYIGRRVRGDHLVAFSAKNHSWPRFQDVKTNLSYPTSRGHGKILTHIEIHVNQTSNLGQAYIVRGGIHQRFVTIIVEAYKTLYFNFTATFYGL